MEACRDALRMHNGMVGYIFLLDGLGRFRFAGCGHASEEEVQKLIELTYQLLPFIAENTVGVLYQIKVHFAANEDKMNNRLILEC
jgi:ATP10 protein